MDDNRQEDYDPFGPPDGSTMTSGPPARIHQMLIRVEWRNDQLALPDEPADRQSLNATQFLKPDFMQLPSANLRCHHLSFESFLLSLSRYFGASFDPKKDEIGWVQEPPRPGMIRKYNTVVDEVTFHNAIAVQQRACDKTSTITLHVWKPKRTEPPFRHSRRAADGVPHPPARHPTEAGVPENTPEGETGDNKARNPLPMPVDQSSDAEVQQSPGGGEANATKATETVTTDTQSISSKQGTAPTDNGSSMDRGLPDRAAKPNSRAGTTPLSPAREKTPPSVEQTTDRDGDTEMTGPKDPNIDHPQFDPDEMFKNEMAKDNVEPTREDDEPEEDFEVRLSEWREKVANATVERLRDGLSSTKCEHITRENWHATCDFFNWDKSNYKTGYIVTIYGFKARLLPAQAISVWVILQKYHIGPGSAIMGHDMGIGKTIIAMALHHVQHCINLMHLHVHQYPDKHLKPGYPGDAPCPINEEVRKHTGFDCCCSRSSPTHFTRATYGCTIIMVPVVVLPVFYAAFHQCYDPEDNPLEIMVDIAHGDYGGLSKEAKELIRCKYQSPTILKRPYGVDEAVPETPRLQPTTLSSRVMIVTTSSSLLSHVINPMEVRFTYTCMVVPPKSRTGKETKVSRTVSFHPLFVGMIFRDEAHIEKRSTSTTIGMLGRLNTLTFRTQNPKMFPPVTPMTGTPVTNGPSDMAYYIMAMVRPWWAQNPVLKKWMGNEVITLGSEWDKAVRNRSVPDELFQSTINRFRPLMEELMIRFTKFTEFLDAGKVVIVPPNYFVRVECQNDPRWEREIAEEKERVDKDMRRREAIRLAKHKKSTPHLPYVALQQDQPNHYYRGRLCTSFPHLLTLQYEDGNLLRLTEQEWIENIRSKLWTAQTETDPYFTNIHAIAASSAKLAAIGAHIKQYRNVIDGDGKLTRLVFCSYFYVGAWILYMWMIHVLKIPAEEIIFMSKLQTPSQNTKALARWADPENPKQPRYIIATSSTMGVGVTLNEARGIGMLEPDFRLTTSLQCYSRVCRQGNKNKNTFCWSYVVKDNPIEEKIEDINNLRSKISGAIVDKK